MNSEQYIAAVGESNLPTLLASLQPHLHPAVYVFSTLPSGVAIPPELVPICQFQETEGLTLIMEQAEAQRFGLSYLFSCRRITLTVHSSLAAVGLLASVTQALAAQDISVNAVSAYYHDHLFVPCDRAEAAMTCLQQLVETHSRAADFSG